MVGSALNRHFLDPMAYRSLLDGSPIIQLIAIPMAIAHLIVVHHDFLSNRESLIGTSPAAL